MTQNYLTAQLSARMAQRLLVRPELPEFASVHFNLSTIEYIHLTECDEFSDAVVTCRAEFTAHIADTMDAVFTGTPDEQYRAAKVASRELQSFRKYPDAWGI